MPLFFNKKSFFTSWGSGIIDSGKLFMFIQINGEALIIC